MSNVAIRNLQIQLGGTKIIESLDLDVKSGEFVVLLGPSGCGKSTLLHSIAGLIDTTAGQIEIGGKDMTWADPKDRGIALVFQSYALYPTMNVENNMSFGLRINGTPKAEIARRVSRASDMLQLGPLLKRKPANLSGGQRQRVAIGRAIVREAGVMLFDEPLSNLDAKLRTELRRELKQLHKQLGATMIYVTHDQVEAMTLADKIVVLRAGEVMQVGTPLELYHNPANQFVAGFLGSPKMNFLEVDVKEAGDGRVTVASPALEPVSIPHAVGRFVPGGRAILGVRPQFLHPGQFADRGHVHGLVSLVERLGTETVLNVDLTAGGRIVVALDGDQPFDLGSELLVGFEPERAHLFEAA